MNIHLSSLPDLLIVDDDDRLRQLLETYLTENGFKVDSVENTAKARKKLQEKKFGLIILDIMMPGETGLEFVESLRKNPLYFTLPVLFLTALGDGPSRIQGFEKGGDEYLSKPFEPKELVLRIKNILKRTFQITNRYVLYSWTFDYQKKILRKGEATIVLTSTESELLHFLILNRGTVVSRYDLSEHLTGVSPRTIDVQITRLRRKIEQQLGAPHLIQTIRHKGYLLCLEE